jgi:hypothetical protein
MKKLYLKPDVLPERISITRRTPNDPDVWIQYDPEGGGYPGWGGEDNDLFHWKFDCRAKNGRIDLCANDGFVFFQGNPKYTGQRAECLLLLNKTTPLGAARISHIVSQRLYEDFDLYFSVRDELRDECFSKLLSCVPALIAGMRALQAEIERLRAEKGVLVCLVQNPRGMIPEVINVNRYENREEIPQDMRDQIAAADSINLNDVVLYEGSEPREAYLAVACGGQEMQECIASMENALDDISRTILSNIQNPPRPHGLAYTALEEIANLFHSCVAKCADTVRDECARINGQDDPVARVEAALAKARIRIERRAPTPWASSSRRPGVSASTGIRGADPVI